MSNSRNTSPKSNKSHKPPKSPQSPAYKIFRKDKSVSAVVKRRRVLATLKQVVRSEEVCGYSKLIHWRENVILEFSVELSNVRFEREDMIGVERLGILYKCLVLKMWVKDGKHVRVRALLKEWV